VYGDSSAIGVGLRRLRRLSLIRGVKPSAPFFQAACHLG
jgi:hypothetical protein